MTIYIHCGKSKGGSAYFLRKMKMWKSGYDTEQALVEDFKRTYLKSLKNGEGVSIFTETQTTWGVVDILAVHYDNKKLGLRKKESDPCPEHFTNLSAYAMLYLSNRLSVTIEELSLYLKANNGIVARVLEILKSRGLAYIYKSGKVRARACSKIFVIKDIIAFEAKISNWRRAINQAERHLWFTNSSFIVLPKLTNKTLERIRSECANRGIGLITQFSEDSFKIVKEPLHRENIDTFFSWKLNEMLLDGSLSNEKNSSAKNP